MSMIKLALSSFRASFKNYLSLIVSLAFTIMIFLNFQNLIDSHVLDGLGQENQRNVVIMIEVITVVLICFMFFFIWYATNVFLTKRKKEIGIYIFMGLTNQKIGLLYMIETTMIGLLALVCGIVFGQLTTQLFQMVIAAISEIAITIEFRIALTPILFTSLAYLSIYILFVIKGYINILRSSVLDMVSASRQNEFVLQKNCVLLVKTVLGVTILILGYYLAVKDGGPEIMANVLAAVIFVIVGTYLLFGGLIPILYQTLAKNKVFLYRKERTLWINNVIFRIKRNYRTYAIVSVLMLCSVTALSTGFALNNRYQEIVRFSSAYSYQLSSTRTDLESGFLQSVEKQNEIAYSSKAELLHLDDSRVDLGPYNTTSSFISFSQVKQIAKKTGLEFPYQALKDGEVIEITNLPLLSFTMDSGVVIQIDGKDYKQVAETSQPYLGYFQRLFNCYILNDTTYERLRSTGTTMTIYNAKIKDESGFSRSLGDIQKFMKGYDDTSIGLVKNDPQTNEAIWIKILYSVCIFVFMVFVMASGSIIFMKLYNDAFEEKEHYAVLYRMGIQKKTMKKSIAKELRFAYAAPLIVMSISSYFSVHCLGELMKRDLLMINLTSVAVSYVFCYICYRLSIAVYMKNAGIQAER